MTQASKDDDKTSGEAITLMTARANLITVIALSNVNLHEEGTRITIRFKDQNPEIRQLKIEL